MHCLFLVLVAVVAASAQSCTVTKSYAKVISDSFNSWGTYTTGSTHIVDVLFTNTSRLSATFDLSTGCAGVTFYGAYPTQCSNSTSASSLVLTCDIDPSVSYQEFYVTDDSGDELALLHVINVAGVIVNIEGAQAPFNMSDSNPENLTTACHTVVYRPALPDFVENALQYCGVVDGAAQVCVSSGDLAISTDAVQAQLPNPFYFSLATNLNEGAVISYPYNYYIVDIDADTFTTSPGQIYNVDTFTQTNYGPYYIITGSPNITFSLNTTFGGWPVKYNINGQDEPVTDGSVALTANSNTTIVISTEVPDIVCPYNDAINYTFNVFQVPLFLESVKMSVPFTFDPNTFQYTVTTASFLVDVTTSGNPLITCYFPNQPAVACTQSLKVAVPSVLNIILYVGTDNPPYSVEYSITFTH